MEFPIVMLTDTIFGLVAPALDPKAIRRLKKLKGRAKGKPFIILISSVNELKKFKIKLTAAQKTELKKLWPGPVSIVLGRHAFRVPKPLTLRRFLARTGPLAAPSANPEGLPPARNIEEARKYFGDKVARYISGTVKNDQPSTLIKLSPSGQITVLRQGVADIGKSTVQ